MNNTDILRQLIAIYGLEKAISYCEMNIFVYTKMYEEFSKSNEKEELTYEYAYQQDWWEKALEGLTCNTEKK